MSIGSFDMGSFLASLRPGFGEWWFVPFVLFAMLWWWAAPRPRRWVVLLVFSFAFACLGGLSTVVFAVFATSVTWLGGMAVEAADRGSRRRKRVLWLFLAILVATLIGVKLSWRPAPVGISYYTFSCLAYLAEVYRGKELAERSVWRMALFVSFFPKLLEGPIERRGHLMPQLLEGRDLTWGRFVSGARLALWGYLKKMIVADRLAIMTTAAFAQSSKHGGLLMLVMAGVSAMQLYCDFSGCMDIARGVAQVFGVELASNFRQPFLSTSAAEFWRRWHTTLGAWFKDYVYLPLSVSPRLMAVAMRIRRRWGRDAARDFMQVVPLLIVWMLTGLWHGTGENYIVWGIYWGIIVAGGAVFRKGYGRLADRLRVNLESPSWRAWQCARTFLLFSIGRLITVPNDLAETWRILTSVFLDARPWELVDKTIFTLGLDNANFMVAVVAIAIVFAVDLLHERGISVRDRMDSWNVVARDAAIVFALLSLMVLGIYGPGYDASAFAYAGF